MRWAIAAAVMLPALARAEPVAVRFPEQAPPREALTARVSVDSAIVTGVPEDARNVMLTVDLHGRRGNWVFGIELGHTYWDDSYTIISEHHAAGLQPRNPVLRMGYWGGGELTQYGVHGSVMLKFIDGVPDDDFSFFGSRAEEKAPSQLARFGAHPVTMPEETAISLGLAARHDDGRFVMQATTDIQLVAANYYAEHKTPSRFWVAAGAGFRPRPSIAVTLHALGQRSLRRKNDAADDGVAVGAGAHVGDLGGGAVSLRFDRRIDGCNLGTYFPSGGFYDTVGHCARVAVDYARTF